MKLDDLIHASTRPGWAVRLLVYVALIVTVSFLVQLFQLW